MANYWLHRIEQDATNKALLDEAMQYFSGLADEYAAKIEVKGHSIVGVAAEIPDLSIKVHRYWSEIGAIYDLLALRRRVALGTARQHFTEVYPRALSGTQAEKYAEAASAVILWDEALINIEFVKAQWEAVSKGVERLHYQIRTIAELYRLGFDAATI